MVHRKGKLGWDSIMTQVHSQVFREKKHSGKSRNFNKEDELSSFLCPLTPKSENMRQE
jgi:hypothetical protein